jgi:hypothetical protein
MPPTDNDEAIEIVIKAIITTKEIMPAICKMLPFFNPIPLL